MGLRPSFRDRAVKFVLEWFDITVEDLVAHRRQRHLVHARAMFVWLTRTYRPEVSTTVIGRWIDRDHSTVLHLHLKAVALRTADRRFDRGCEQFAALYRTTMEVPYACA